MSFFFNETIINEFSTFTNLKKLTLNGCDSSYNEDVNFEPLKKLENVTELTLSSSTFFNLIEYFKNLKKVEILRYGPDTISNNNIEELVFDEMSNYDSIAINFEGLTNLKKLTIFATHCDSGDLDIRFPKNLNYLSLGLYNPTKDLIKEISNLENLETLKFNINVFKPENDDLTPLKKLSKLTKLHLSCYLYDDTLIVPDSIFSLINLKELSLSNVENPKVLENVDKLKNLEYLSLTDVGVTSIDKIVNLKNLKYLNLNENEIATLNDKIGDLKNLEHLELKNNKFKTLPETMSKLSNLEYLDLYYNQLTEIPEFLNKLPNLKYINFNNCENIKGKTLTNDSLEECYYNGIKKGNICKAKEMKCISEDEKIPLCTENSNKISTNGKCGPEDGHCPDDKCCSKYGYCGTSDKHCGTGCQSEFGHCTSTTNVKISINGKCGPEDGKCPDNKCCSKYGYCGTSEKHCGTGCQSEFGQCTSTTNVKISTNGKCGPEDGKCPDNKCCSKYGYCGTSEKHCGTGCQSEFGQCTSTTNVKISTNGKCGPEDGKCPDNKCCSKYGYCGTSDKHCSTGCQSKYGKCL